ncbi:MAG: choice-of-anchor Q domain-containing protein, partial [Planctomycetaceae bacterium]
LDSGFTVDSTLDAVDANVGDGRAEKDLFGNTTLRAAIMESNVLPGMQTLIVPDLGTFLLTIAGAEENAARTGDLDIADNLRIIGDPDGNAAIDANALDRIFDVLPGVSLELVNITVTNGVANDGGAIRNRGMLTVTGGAIRDSHATFLGGGLFNDGDATLTGAQITGNSSDFRGGGVYNFDAAGANVLVITNATLDDNHSAARGGGIYNDDQLVLGQSTLSNNTAGSRGGGLFNSGGASLANVTVSGNRAASQGGGIGNERQIVINSSTIVDNQADASGGGVSSISNGVEFLQVTVKNSIIAENLGLMANNDVNGAFVSNGNNLIGDAGTASGFINGASGDQVGNAQNPIDPLLGSLDDNGGPAFTHAPLFGSPVIDAGNNTGAPNVDQRGR